MTMQPCDSYQPQLLHHLFGLLDETEAATLQAHLRDCPACEAARKHAEEQQRLLSAAAKGDFSGVQFRRPAAEPAEARVLPLGSAAPAVRRRARLRWAVAASLLLGLSGSLLYAGYSWHHHSTSLALAQQEEQQLAQRRDQDKARVAEEMREVQNAISDLEKSWRREVERAQQDAAKKPVPAIVGPATAQAGAINPYQLVTPPQPMVISRNSDQKLQLRATVRDEARPDPKKNVVFEKDIDDPHKPLFLPQDVPVTPGSRLIMEVRATDLGNKQVVWETRVPLTMPAYLTHLTTDRYLYRPGETVYLRSLTLERFSLQPADKDFQLHYVITDPRGNRLFETSGLSKIKGPDNQVLTLGKGSPLRGLGVAEFPIPPEAAEGEYSLTVSEGQNLFPAETRKFLVKRFQAPRLNKEIEFTRKSYGPGDEVEAVGKVAKVEGGAKLADQPVVAEAQVDGQTLTIYKASALRTNEDGVVRVKFRLPARIGRGEGTLMLSFTDGGVTERIVRPVPIVLKRLLVDFYPEGGDLVAGVPNRVYFQAQTTLNRPADLRGRVVDEDGREAAVAQTLHDDAEPGVNQGMGRFEFTPQPGKRYELKIDSPLGIEGKYLLPRTHNDGVVLSVAEGVVTDTIRVVLHTTQTKKLLVGAYCRGRLIQHQFITAQPGKPNFVELKTDGGPGGVYRITVFEERRDPARPFKPVAERLLYRRPDRLLHVDVTPDKATYSPGERVTLKVKTTDEKDRTAPAVLLLSAVDQSFVKLGDEKTARSMPTHFFLTTEVKRPEDLEYADFLVSKNAKTEAALDLLLGTQGWRRFLEQNLDQFQRIQQRAEENRALLAMAAPTNLSEQNQKNVDAEYFVRWAEAQDRLNAVEDKEAGVVNARQDEINRAHAAAAAAATGFDNFLRTLRNVGLALLAALLLTGGLAAMVMGLRRIQAGGTQGVPMYIGGVCSLAVLLLGTLVAVLPYAANGLRRAERNGMFARNVQQAAPGEFVARDDRMAKKEMPPPLEAEMPAPAAAKFGDPMTGRGGVEKVKPGKAMPMRIKGAMPRVKLQQNKADIGGHRAVEAKGPAMLPPVPFIDQRAFQDDGKPGFGARGRPEQGLAVFGGERRLVLPGDEQQLRRQRQYHVLALQRFGRALPAVPVLEPFALREYAHQHAPAKDDVRSDFAATLLWQPVLLLPDGTATVSFDLSDAVTSFEVTAYAHGSDGRLGDAKKTLESRLPFHVEPKLPVEVSNTDKILVPVSVANATDTARDVELNVEASGLTLNGPKDRWLKVGPRKNEAQLLEFRPSILEGSADLLFTAKSKPFAADRVRKSFAVVPEGFPQVGKYSDVLEGIDTRVIEMPETWLPGTLKCQLQVFPSTLADLQKGLEAMLRQPGGCFEQSSASNYPNVLILSYLKASDQALPEVEQRSRALLTSGYRQLTSFECLDPTKNRRGYEWFGGTAPPHEALTAYGLLEFRDMERVFPVDKDMIERTRTYLLDQRDGRGGFKRNARALDTFGRAPQHITSAYIVWALTESGDSDVDRELDALTKQAGDSKDPYFLALVGNSLINRGKAEAGVVLLKKLAGFQQADGHLDAAETSITHSGGNDLRIETTALATLAWLKANRPAEFQENVRKAVAWVGQQRGGHGGFGSTQSTILALKTLIAYTAENRKTAEAGTLQLRVNGHLFAKDFPAGARDEIILAVPEADQVLKPGKNKVELEISGKNVFPYTLTWSYRTQKPAHDAAKCPVHLTTKLDRRVAKDRVRLTAVVENKTGKGQGMAVVVIGLPGGLEVPLPFNELRDMARLREDGTKPGLISAFEIKGRELILYWRDLAPDQRIEVNLDLLCTVPGEYRGPASRAYLYYNADHKFWTEPLSVTIEP
jgi:hypothetical protein